MDSNILSGDGDMKMLDELDLYDEFWEWLDENSQPAVTPAIGNFPAKTIPLSETNYSHLKSPSTIFRHILPYKPTTTLLVMYNVLFILIIEVGNAFFFVFWVSH